MRASRWAHEPQWRSESDRRDPATRRPIANSMRVAAAQEPIRSDSKGGELCLSRAKSEETLMEARSDPDVQIGRQT